MCASTTDRGVLERGMGTVGQNSQVIAPESVINQMHRLTFSKCYGLEATAQTLAVPGNMHDARQEARQ